MNKKTIKKRLLRYFKLGFSYKDKSITVTLEFKPSYNKWTLILYDYESSNKSTMCKNHIYFSFAILPKLLSAKLAFEQ